MARISKGILGSFSGTVGTVVGASWRGVEYIRSRPGKRKGELTEKQKSQHARFSMMLGFLTTMKDLLFLGYKDHASRMTEANSALSFNLKNAVSGVYPAFAIVFPQVLVTRGSLPNATAPGAVAGAAGIINFNWTDNSGIGKAKGADKAILVAYCEALQQTVYVMDALRSAAAGNLAVPGFSGESVQTWISFITDDGKDIATSVFTGVVNVL